MEPGLNQEVTESTPSPGTVLKQAREARGISLNEAARMLKLAPRQVEAIESGEFDKLPGLAWVRGFVRNYARFVELDPAPLLAQIETPIRAAMRLSPESNVIGSVPNVPEGYRSHTPVAALVLASIVVVLGLLAWHFDLGSLIERKAVPQSTEPVATASEPAFPPHTDETAVVTAQTEEVAGGLTGSSDAVASVPETAASLPAAAASLPVTTAGGGAVVGAGEGSLMFSFSQEAWVEVRDASDKIIFSRLNKGGDQQEVRGTPPFTLVIGNAPSVTLTFNGQSVDLKSRKVSVARFSLR